MGRRTSLRLGVGVAAVAMLATACSGSDDGGDSGSSGSGESGGEFSMALGSDPSYLAPTSQCYDSVCSQALAVLYTGLVSVDPETQEQVMGTAESIESEDGQVWTIKLKPGLKFHNGEPVDAESYLRAWNHSAYGPNATQTGFFFSPVEGYEDLQGDKPKSKTMTGLEAVNDTTIEVTLSQPFSQWPLVMGYAPAFAPMAQECLDDLRACNEQPIGNGPYQMVGKWKHNQSISVEKWDGYTGPDPANADAIDFLLYSDEKTAYRDYQAGNVDLLNDVDPSQVPQAQAEAGERFLTVDDGSFNYLGLPLFDPAYQDVRIRQALSLAIDRETIIDRVLNGLGTPATDVLPPFITGSRDDACEYCEYNPEEAKRLFDEAGGLPDNTVTIWFNNDTGAEPYMQAVAEGWKNDLGVEYEFESQPFTPYLETLEQGGYDGPFRLGWLPDYPSPENYLDPVYGEGSTNYMQWSGPAHDEFLQLIAEADSAPSIEEGIPTYQEAADIVLEELPVIPTYFGKTAIVYADNLDNVSYDPLQQILLGEVTVS
jgi:ABC-type oligopeptide transport system substrate-binding subunit